MYLYLYNILFHGWIFKYQVIYIRISTHFGLTVSKEAKTGTWKQKAQVKHNSVVKNITKIIDLGRHKLLLLYVAGDIRTSLS